MTFKIIISIPYLMVIYILFLVNVSKSFPVSEKSLQLSNALDVFLKSNLFCCYSASFLVRSWYGSHQSQ